MSLSHPSLAHPDSAGLADLNLDGSGLPLAATPTPSSKLPTTTTTTTSSSALSNRLAQVLSRSYLDPDIRRTLATLDARHIQNTPSTRRQLRLDIQREAIAHNAAIIADFGRVADQLRRVGEVVARLDGVCAEMRRDVDLARQDAAPVLEEYVALAEARRETAVKRALLDAFTDRFVPTKEDELVLTSSLSAAWSDLPDDDGGHDPGKGHGGERGPVSDRFFAALSRVKRIRRDCEVLLGATENQRLSLEIMEKTSRLLDAAYQTLYTWTQREVQSLKLEELDGDVQDTPRLLGLRAPLRRALTVLAEKPLLFSRCFDAFAELRDRVLSDSFQAVSVADLSVAADPLRYVGDVLAWVHSAAVSEREALRLLFVADDGELVRGIRAGIEQEPWMADDDAAQGLATAPASAAPFDWTKTLNDLIDRNLSGVTRSLRQRVDLHLQSQESCTTLYDMSNLLGFYERTFAKLAGQQAGLVTCMRELRARCSDRVFEVLDDTVARLEKDPAATAVRTGSGAPIPFVPAYLSDGLATLSKLMKAHASSYEETEASSADTFAPVLSHALTPYFGLVERSVASLPNNTDKDKTARLVLAMNCALAIQQTIEPYPYASAVAGADLDARLHDLREQLCASQHLFLLRESGLDLLMQDLAPFLRAKQAARTDGDDDTTTDAAPSSPSSSSPKPPSLTTIPSLPHFQPAALISISQQLDMFLPSALVDATENLKQLSSTALARSVTDSAAEMFIADFEAVEELIVRADVACGKAPASATATETGSEEAYDEDEDGQPAGLRALFPRTTGEMRVLLS
ncbi:Golgi transport complex subunit 6 [Ascosphaera acerosa]|nr:Golgi transport complex subunit 6 [Ascosphaera acerosa]